MTLRAKTIMVIGITLIGLIIGLFAVSRIILLDSFKRLEEQNTIQNVERIISAFNDTVNKLSSTTSDYSAWDSTYNYVENLNKEYTESEYPTETLTRIKINALFIFDSSKKLLFSKEIDLDTGKEVLVSEDLLNTIASNHSLTYHSNITNMVKGIIVLSNKPAIVVSCPILNSKGEGPIRGSLIMIRYIDSTLIKNLGNTTHLSFSARLFNDTHLPQDFKAIKPLLLNSPIISRPFSNNVVAGYTLLNDINGKHGVIFKIDIPRKIYMQGKGNISIFVLFLTASGLIFCLASLMLLERLVLSRIGNLSSDVNQISNSNDISKRVTIHGKDEISSLSKNINNMLDTIEKSHQKLKKNEEKFKYQSFHDNLTSLYNRAFFDEEMAKISRDIERFKPLSILSIDVDGLKIVNDTFGHKVGDELLKAVSKVICGTFRKTDIIARIGGDEFCLILPKVSHELALERKDKILKLVDEYNNNNPSFLISLSIGVATSSGDPDETIHDIYQRSDDNMYDYKLTQAESTKSKIIDVLLTALAQRDFITQGHLERLAKMSEVIAQRLKLSDNDKRELVLLAKMHDVGKVGIPDEILFKPDKLTPREYEIMQSHSYIGYTIANRSKELSHIASLILHHHEAWDGSGYPSGLKGNDIPFSCRIISVIDSYDAMTSDRPYHTGMSKEEAIENLRKCSGTKYEPFVVEEFIKYLEEQK